METDVLQDHIPFHRSGKLFISVLDLCVRNIFTLEAEMGPVLIMYGRRHFHKQSAGFRYGIAERCICDSRGEIMYIVIRAFFQSGISASVLSLYRRAFDRRTGSLRRAYFADSRLRAGLAAATGLYYGKDG